MSNEAQTTQYAEIGARIAAIRAAFAPNLTQGQWAKSFGFNQSQVSNWETGERRIPVECAEKLSDAYGLTLDFVYRGRRDGLSENASNKL